MEPDLIGDVVNSVDSTVNSGLPYDISVTNEGPARSLSNNSPTRRLDWMEIWITMSME